MIFRRKQKYQKDQKIVTIPDILGQPGIIGKSRLIENIGKSMGWKSEKIQFDAEPITARMVIHRLTGLIEMGVGGYFMLLAFLRHDIIYDIFKDSRIAFVVAGIAIVGFFIFHDGMHRVSDRLKI